VASRFAAQNSVERPELRPGDHLPITPEQIAEVDRPVEEYRQNPALGSAWGRLGADFGTEALMEIVVLLSGRIGHSDGLRSNFPFWDFLLDNRGQHHYFGGSIPPSEPRANPRAV
jgi:hypothetical protein